ncbi:hypothetical protein, partial [Achromobacter insuavis]|uniref:hypothetical protein n=1 Tax=Achromobacter insuavis TaxID=1287735 RepID=UPI001C5541EC
GQNFDAFHVMTRLTDRHKTIPYFKRVLVSSDTWGRSKAADADVADTLTLQDASKGKNVRMKSITLD